MRGEAQYLGKLDRGLGNLALRRLFPMAMIPVLSSSHSNHLPLLLQVGGEEERRRVVVGQVMRFAAMWVKESGCKNLVEEGWGPLIIS